MKDTLKIKAEMKAARRAEQNPLQQSGQCNTADQTSGHLLIDGSQPTSLVATLQHALAIWQ